MRRFSVSVLVLVTACGDGYLAIGDYPAARLGVLCDYFIRCGAIPTIEECRATQPEPRFGSALLAAVDAGTVRWHGDAAHDCLDRADEWSCDRTSETFRTFDCEPFFTGTLGDGESCAIGIECMSNECWTESCTEACCIGYCVGDAPPVVGKIGEVCRLSSCEPGARCESSVCVALSDEGESCGMYADNECAYGLACIDGTCAAPDYNGEPCSESSCAMIGELCGVHGVCEPSGRIGYPCSDDSHCGVNYLCGSDARCKPAPSIGQNCSNYFRRCYDAGAFCARATSVCILPKPDGDACMYSDECESYYCFGGSCLSCGG